jgi:4-carboxymuconolactone decarboxylase
VNLRYEWAHHVAPSKAAGWSEEHAALLRAADELRREAFVSDATWHTLQKFYDTKQLVEIIYTVGGYTMTGVAINSVGIQVEPGNPGMPKE